MNKSFIFIAVFFVSKIESFSYMNGQDISVRSVLTDSCYASINYNILDSGDGHFSEHKRYFGIHNMTVAIPGYEVVYLIKDDVCLYPRLFTLLAKVLPKDFCVTQRWACIQSPLPLSLGFKIKDDVLIISASTYMYTILAPFLTTESISLVKSKDWKEGQDVRDATFTVTVNGLSVVVGAERVVQIKNYSGYWATINLAPYVVGTAVIAAIIAGMVSIVNNH